MKNIIKSLRFDENQWKEIESKMQDLDLSFSNFVLNSLLNYKSKKKKSTIEKELIFELSKWGNNLNQIAKHLNTNNTSLDRVGLEMLNQIENHLKKIRAKYDC